MIHVVSVYTPHTNSMHDEGFNKGTNYNRLCSNSSTISGNDAMSIFPS